MLKCEVLLNEEKEADDDDDATAFVLWPRGNECPERTPTPPQTPSFESSVTMAICGFRESVLVRGVVRAEQTEGEKGGCFTLRMQISDSALISDCKLCNLCTSRGGICWIGGDERGKNGCCSIIRSVGMAGRQDGSLISTQIRRVKRFCLLCVFGLIISKLDPTRSLTVTVRTRMAAPQMPRFDSDAIVAFAMGMFGWELRSGIHRCERRGHVVQVARRF